MRKPIALTLAILMAVLALMPTQVGAQAPGGGGITIPVVAPATATTPEFVGTFTVRSFRVIDGVLTAFGTVVGTLQGSSEIFVRQAAAPVTSITQGEACQILNLTLGPLELNLLGLVVEIPAPIIINIFAEPGPGNLLGNLLCAIAGLLDPGGALPANLQQLVALLNRVLSLL